jgi:hypothetical protein
VVSRLVSWAILYCFNMGKNLFLFLHWPGQIWFTKDLYLFSPKLYFILTLFNIENLF